MYVLTLCVQHESHIVFYISAKRTGCALDYALTTSVSCLEALPPQSLSHVRADADQP